MRLRPSQGKAMTPTGRGTRGKLIVGQSGGCTHVLNASLHGVIAEAQRARSVTAVLGMRHGIEGILRGDILNLSAASPQTLAALDRTPAAALGSCRRRISDEEAAAVVQFLDKRSVRFFIYIGGNDSADTSHRIALAARAQGCDLRVVGVPKTIDNDLPETDHCPGYGSAARFIASVTADTGMETEAMRSVEPVKIVEVMGRNAGWLAAASALAKRSPRDAPHLVWTPEIPFDRALFLRLVRQSLKNPGYCVAVIAETVRDKRGLPVASGGRRLERDAFGHVRAQDAAEYLCGLVRAELGVRARWDKPGTIQRMSSAHFSPVDVREARACGRHAVRLALGGATDCMVVMRRRKGPYAVDYDSTPLVRIANRDRPMPKRFFSPNAMLPTPAFKRYALPLVGDGLPNHPRLAGPRPI